MQKNLSILIILYFFSMHVQADEVKLACVTSDGTKAVDLIINLEAKELRWGIAYDIIHMNDNYITAYERNYGAAVGGEVFVLNRHTGQYLRAGVSKTYIPSQGERSKDSKLRAETYKGRCLNKII